MKKTLIGICLMLSVLGTLSAQNKSKGSYYYDRGMEAMDNQDTDEALRYFRMERAENPRSANGYKGIALCMAYTDVYDSAIYYLQQAIPLAPKKDKAELYLFLGYMYQNSEIYDKALSSYNQAIKIASKDPVCYNARADYYLLIGNYNLAKLDYKKALQLQAAYSRAHIELAKIAFFEEDYNTAIQEADLAIASNSPQAGYYLIRSLIYLGTKQYENSINDLIHSISLGYIDEQFDILRQLAQEEPELLCEMLKTVHQKYPESAVWTAALAIAYYSREEYRTSAQYFLKTNKLYKEPSAITLFRAIDALQLANEYEQALEVSEKKIKITDFNEEEWATHITLLVDCERYDEAIAVADSCLQIFPEDALLLSTKLYGYTQKNDLVGSIQTAKELLEIKDEKHSLEEEIGNFYLLLGDTAAAFDWFQKALEEEDAHPIALHYTGKTKEALQIVARRAAVAESDYDYLQLAHICSIIGATKEALTYMRKSFERGGLLGTKAKIMHGIGFQNIRQLPEFQELIDEYSSKIK